MGLEAPTDSTALKGQAANSAIASRSSADLDLDEVRGNFPALKNDQIFFDNAGGSQVLGSVIDSIRDFLANTNVQLGATYPASKGASDRYKAGYEAAAQYINASATEIVLGSSTTQILRNLSFTLTFNRGDEIVISGVDHEANIAPWVDLAERQGLALKWWRPATKTQPRLTAEGLRELLSPKTRLVTLTHASNILGTIHDVKAIAETAHAVAPGSLVCVDAVAYAPHRPVDVRDLGVDLYAFSWYKVYGPHISMLYASARAQEQIRSLGHFFNPSASLENKIGLAGSTYELVGALPAVVRYLRGREAGIAAHEAALQAALLVYLNGRDDVTIHGETSADPALRVPTVSFTVRGWNARELVTAVEEGTNFGFRYGLFYNNRLVKEFLGLGDDGVVRVSLVHYNTLTEVNDFIAALDKVLSGKK